MENRGVLLPRPSLRETSLVTPEMETWAPGKIIIFDVDWQL